MGLLDEFSEFAKTPAGQGLLGAAFGGLAGARRGQPLNSLGRAGLAGLQGYGGALDRQAQEADAAQAREMRALQVSQAREAATLKQQQQEWLQTQNPSLLATQGALAAGGGPTVGNAANLQPVDPRRQQLWEFASKGLIPVADYIKEIGPKERKLMTVKPGDMVLDESDPGRPVFEAPVKPKKTAIEEMLDAAGITDQSVRQNFILRGLNKQTTHAPAPSATVINRQEGEEAKTVGKFFGDAYANIQNAGFNAQSKVTRYNRLGDLLEGVNTGKFSAAGLEVAKAGQALGFNIDPNIGNKEAAQALSSEIALELRNPSGGAGMPGAMSDKDREFLVSMVPGLATTPQGRKQMLDTAQKLAKRDIEVSKIAREYRKRNGTLDEGFYDELARHSAANPLFPQAAPAGAPAAGFSIRRVR